MATSTGGSAERASAAGTPRFALFVEDWGEVAFRAADVEGFFGGTAAADGRQRVRLAGSSPSGAMAARTLERLGRARSLGNAELWILDDEGRRIGSYFLADAVLSPLSTRPAGPGPLDLDVTGLVLQPPHPLAGPVWEEWRRGRPRRRDRWAELPPDVRAAWLEVVRLAQTAEPEADAAPGSVFELHGAHVDDRASFFCALGEAVNGPGGYFGADLDGLADCLRGGFGASVPFTLVWPGAAEAAARLNRAANGAGGRFHDRLMEVLDRAAVTVRP